MNYLGQILKLLSREEQKMLINRFGAFINKRKNKSKDKNENNTKMVE